MIIKQPVLVFFALFFLGHVFAQDQAGLDDFNNEREKIGSNAMFVLGGWAVANIIGSGAGAVSTNGEAYYFHSMNVLWNIANLGIAIPGYIGTKRRTGKTMDIPSTINKQIATEKLYLINGILDIGYFVMGYYTYNLGTKYEKRREMMHGYGSSMMMQGMFLLLNDIIVVWIHGKHRKNKLDPILNNLKFSGNAVGLSIPIK